MSEGAQVKQVIIFRKDLNMRKGKIAAQVAHASMAVILNQAHIFQPTPPVGPNDRAHLILYMNEETAAWVTGKFTKIVLSVNSLAELIELHDLAAAARLPHALITDSGATEFHGVATDTALAIGPAKSELIDVLCGPNGKVKCSLA